MANSGAQRFRGTLFGAFFLLSQDSGPIRLGSLRGGVGRVVDLLDYLRKHLFFIPYFSLVFLTGCASVSVVSVSENRSMKPHSLFPDLKVGKIHSLRPLPTKSATLHLDRSSGSIYRDHPSELEESLWSDRIYASVRKTWDRRRRGGMKHLPPPPYSSEELVLNGQIWKANPGNRLLRSTLGMGLGRSEMEGRFYVYNLKKSKTIPWLSIQTSGGSGREPGLAFALVPGPSLALNIINWSAVVSGAISHGFRGLGQDSSRTGKMLALLISERMERLPSGAPPPPKFQGHHSLPVVGDRPPRQVRVDLLGRPHLPHPLGETMFLDNSRF